MIYDFGCLGNLGLQQILLAYIGGLSTLAVVAGLAVIAAFPRRAARFQAQDIFVGWGLLASVMVLVGVLFTHALSFVALAFFALTAIAIVPALKRHYFYAPFWLVALFPGLSILGVINYSGIAAWDDFAQWVPNALYLFHYDSLPAPSLPPPHSLFPGYPYALPFLTYMASWLAGGFLVQGGAMMAFLLLTAFSSMLAEISPLHADTKSCNLLDINRMALALLVVTFANPSFDVRYANTGDIPTMVLTGALGLMLWRVTQNKNAPTISTILPIALTSTALVLTKQSNIILLALLSCAFLVVAAKNKLLKYILPAIPMMLMPALILRLVWQHYVDIKMSGNGFTFHPFSTWRFDLIRPLLQAIGQTTLSMHGLSASTNIVIVWSVAIYGIANFFRPPTPLRNLALMTSIVFLGYVLFLITAYLGATFTEDEIIHAASFYRYLEHTALLAVSVLWVAAPFIWKKLKNSFARYSSPTWRVPSQPVKRVAACLLPVIVLSFVLFIHDKRFVPRPWPELCAMRLLGHQVAQTLPNNTTLAILEPEKDVWGGIFTHIINFELALEEVRTNRVIYLAGFWNKTPEKTDQYLDFINANKYINAILVHQAIRNPLRIDNYDNATAPLLIYRAKQGWKQFASQKILVK